jgi:hypothetical protein
MGADDDGDCVEHVWQLDELHLSIARGAELTESCVRCPAVRYRTDEARKNRPPLGRV